MADQIEAQQINPADILDVTVSNEATEAGPWWSATIYWRDQASE
jgi:hypothetical protein